MDLASYSIALYSNGSPIVSQTVTTSGILADGDVFVLAHPTANAGILAVADATSGTVANWNGDDAIALRKAASLIDVFGQIGFDPGTEWGSGLTSTADNTLRRKGTIEAGNGDGTDGFDPAVEWDGFAVDTFDGLGSHTVTVGTPTNPSGVGAANPATLAAGGSTTLTVAATPGTNPTSTGLAVSADLTPIGGPATQTFYDDGLTGGDTTAADNVFTWTATVGAATTPGNKTIPATITDAQTRTGSASIALTVEGPPTQIWEIQQASHLSTFDNQQVFGVEGVVTATRNGGSGGFWMTDPTPDAGPGSDATSNGIFVFSPGTQTVVPGTLVRVNGTVDEFRSGGSGSTNLTTTEIVSPVVTVVSTGHAVPTTVIGVDRVPPGVVIDNDSTSTVEAAGAIFDPTRDGIDFWESLEGMRLSVADAVAVGPRNNFGEIAVVSQLTNVGLRTPRGGILVRQLGPAGDYRPGDFNPERLILDDVLTPTPSVNVGDEFATDPVGVLDYGFNNFKLYVTADPGRVDNLLQPEVTRDDSRRELSVATFNVENLSPLDTPEKVSRLATQIVANLKSPDVIAVQEVQDNTGPSNDGTVAANLSWQLLIDAIVVAGGPRYEYRQIDPQNNADGGAPGGNIRVGFLFQPSRDLAFVDRPGGNATTDTNVVRARRGGDDDRGRSCDGRAQLTISPGRITHANLGGANAFNATRKSLAGEFCFRGETVFIVANHLSSKGDDRPLFGRFQPPFRLTEFQSLATDGTEDGWRHAQAQAINDFVDEILAVDKNAHVIVLGDINDFDFSETVDILAGERVALNPGVFMPDADGSGQTARTGKKPILTSLFDRLRPEERYSYVFDGNSQVLDQILVSNSLLKERPAYDVVHVNAEFANQASDHDPSVMVVRLEGDDD